ncbi:MAG: hypothetical protein KBB91_03055 [Candidatus Pacebacteria bacterium]|nr:hypothetical protein [Candidatus Paceibacterota bacterium]MBP9701184.1 hypothetical protein [Candidatus Paceibacterota bacterium]
MITKDLEDYIRTSLAKGIPYETIRTNLLTQGWHADEIQQAYTAQVSISLTPISQHRKPVFSKIVLILPVLVLGAAVAYAHYTGYFMSLDTITSQSLTAAQQSKSASFDTTVTVDIPLSTAGVTDSLEQQMQSSFSGTYSLTAKGSFDFTDTVNSKTTTALSLVSNKLTTSLELRTVQGTLYARILKAPTIAFLPVLTSIENKWVSFPYDNPSSQATQLPIAALTGVDMSIIEKLTDEQKQGLYDITKDATFIRITKRLLPEKIGDTLSYHFIFDLDREGIEAYLENVKEYIRDIGKDDSYLSTFDPTQYGENLDKVKNFSGELWIGKNDHLLYKALVGFDIETEDQKSVAVSIASIFSGWNTPVVVEIPQGVVTFEQLLGPLLGASREKGMDAQIKSSLSNLRAEAELYYDSSAGGSYSGFCGSAVVQNTKSSIQTSTTTFTCKDSTTQWAATAPISDTSYFCVDSTGFSGSVTKLASTTSCIQ